MPENHRFALGAVLAAKTVFSSRTNGVVFAFPPLLFGVLWHFDSFETASGFLILLFPYVFLFLSRDMMKSDIESGALENTLFIGGVFRNVLWVRFLSVFGIGLAYVFLLLVFCAAAGMISGHPFPWSPLQVAGGLAAGAYFAGWGGFLGFFLKSGSNVLSVLLLQAATGVVLLMTLGRHLTFFSMFHDGVFPDAGSLLKFLAFLAVFPNLLVRKNLAPYIPLIVVLSAAAWILVRIASSRAEMTK